MNVENKLTYIYAADSLINIHVSNFMQFLIPRSTDFYIIDSSPSSSSFLDCFKRLRGLVEHDNIISKLTSGPTPSVNPLGSHHDRPQVRRLRETPYHQLLLTDSIIPIINTGLDDTATICVIVGVAIFIVCFISALCYGCCRRRQVREALESEELLESPRDDMNMKSPTQSEKSGLQAFMSGLLTPLSPLSPYRPNGAQRQRRRSTNTPANGDKCIGVLYVRREGGDVPMRLWQRHVVRLQEGSMELFNLEDDSSEIVDLKGYGFSRESDRLSLIATGDPHSNDILFDLKDEGVSCTMFQGTVIRSDYPTLDDWIHFLGINVDIANKYGRHGSGGGTIGAARFARRTSGTRSSKGSNSTLSSPRYRAESGRPWGLSSGLLSPVGYGGNSPHHGEISNHRYKSNSNGSDNMEAMVARRLDGSFEESVDSNRRRNVPRTRLKSPPPALISPRPLSPSLTSPPPPHATLESSNSNRPNSSHKIFISKNNSNDDRNGEDRSLNSQCQLKVPSDCSNSDNVSLLHPSADSDSGIGILGTALSRINSLGNIQIISTQIGDTNNPKSAVKIPSPEKLSSVGHLSSQLQRLLSARDVPSSQSPTTLPEIENPMPRRNSTETPEQPTRPQLSQSNTSGNQKSFTSILFMSPDSNERDKSGNQSTSTTTRTRGRTMSLEDASQPTSIALHSAVTGSTSAKTFSWGIHSTSAPSSAHSTPVDSRQQQTLSSSPTSHTRPSSFRSMLNRLTINTNLQSDAYPQTHHSDFHQAPPPVIVFPNNPSVYPTNLVPITMPAQSCPTSPSGLFSHPEESEDIDSPMPTECAPNLSTQTVTTSSSTGTINSTYTNALHDTNGKKANFWTGLIQHASGANSQLRSWSMGGSPALLNPAATTATNSSTASEDNSTASIHITAPTVTSAQKESLEGRFTLTWKPPNRNPSEKSIVGLLEARRGANRPSFNSVGGSAPPSKNNSPATIRRKTPT